MKRILILTAFAGLFSLSLTSAQNIEAMEQTLKESIKKGHITELQAKAMIKVLHQGEKPKGDKVEEEIVEWVEKVGDKIDHAVAKGELSSEEGWDKWNAFKKKELEPKLEYCLKEKLVSKEWVEELELGIEMAEVGAMLEEAVENGEMTEQQAWKKWQEAFGDVIEKEDTWSELFGDEKDDD